jgi:hypothetical protein
MRLMLGDAPRERSSEVRLLPPYFFIMALRSKPMTVMTTAPPIPLPRMSLATLATSMPPTSPPAATPPPITAAGDLTDHAPADGALHTADCEGTKGWVTVLRKR